MVVDTRILSWNDLKVHLESLDMGQCKSNHTCLFHVSSQMDSNQRKTGAKKASGCRCELIRCVFHCSKLWEISRTWIPPTWTTWCKDHNIYIYIISVLYTQYMEILWHVLFLQSKSHWGPLSRPAPGPREPHAPLAPRNGAPRNGALRRPRRWEKQVVFGRVATKRGPKSLKVLQIYDAL